MARSKKATIALTAAALLLVAAVASSVYLIHLISGSNPHGKPHLCAFPASEGSVRVA